MIFKSNINNFLEPRVHYDKFNIFVLAVVAFFAFFVNSNAIQPDIMECRNIVTAREMVHDGHWIRTTLNGEPRFEKPPLPTWLAAVAEVVAPDSVPAQRAMSGLAATMMILFFYLLWRDYTRDRMLAFVSSLVLLTCYSVILMGRTATWDIYCHAFAMGGIYFLFKGLYLKPNWRTSFDGPKIVENTYYVSADDDAANQQDNSENKSSYKFLYRNMLLAGLFFGLSFLSKGPTSYYGLLLPFVAAVLIVNCKLKRSGADDNVKVSDGVIDVQPVEVKKIKIWPAILMMILVCVVIGGSWYFYLYLSDKQELLNVAGKETSAWTGYHTRPWWFYYKFTFETGIWGVMLICALFFTYWKHRAKDISVSGVQIGNVDSNKFAYKEFCKKYLMPLLWMIISLVLLSAMPEKKKRYLLPLLIPASYLIGYLFIYWQACAKSGLWRAKENIVGRDGEVLSNSKMAWRSGKFFFKFNTILIAAVVAIIPIACYILLYSKGTISGGLMAKIAIGIYIIFAFLVRYIRRQQPLRFLYFTVVLMAFVEISVLPYIGKIVGYQGNITMTALHTIPEVKDMPLYYNADTLAPRVEVIYDVHRPVRPLNLQDSSAVRAAAPCAVLTHNDFCKEASAAAIHAVDTSRIGIFDNNRWLKTNRNYRPEFVYVVTLLK
jgi:4-amino-4-deoxy-L-arabinose transferase-like glycosyltransferase